MLCLLQQRQDLTGGKLVSLLQAVQIYRNIRVNRQGRYNTQLGITRQEMVEKSLCQQSIEGCFGFGFGFGSGGGLQRLYRPSIAKSLNETSLCLQ
jgi:hypothetical protein